MAASTAARLVGVDRVRGDRLLAADELLDARIDATRQIKGGDGRAGLGQSGDIAAAETAAAAGDDGNLALQTEESGRGSRERGS